jgi:hypothetical protein
MIYDQLVQLITRVPTDKRRIGQPQGHDIYLLSPSCYRKDAPSYGRDKPPFYDEVEFKHNVIHELVHVWEELSSPTGAMDTRPGWFSEGLAMYVSESFTEHEFKVSLKDDYIKGIIPKPDEIREDRNYTWGCILFEFLLKEFGPQQILTVIKDTCEKDIISLLDSDTDSCIKGYLDFTQARIERISPAT